MLKEPIKKFRNTIVRPQTGRAATIQLLYVSEANGSHFMRFDFSMVLNSVKL